VEFVGASAGDGIPETVAGQQPLPVLGVFEIARNLELLWILRYQRVEILLGDALETRAIALALRNGHARQQRPDRQQHDGPAEAGHYGPHHPTSVGENCFFNPCQWV
jgi:hypothetical protein